MSLFGKIQQLYRSDRFQLEDFHTEIVAQILRGSETLALAWLRSLQATNLKRIDRCTVETQKTFVALPGHDTDSRPDVVIYLTSSSRREVVFVESKVGSHAGANQLERYLEHLEKLRSDLNHAALIFITRDFEADYAESFARLERTIPGVLFRQTRWYEFYRQLCTITKGNPLAQQLALFMQEHRMNTHPRFRTIDIAALENFLSAKALMDETLQGKVRQTMSQKLQDSSALSRAMNQLSGFGRYVLYATSAPRADYECLVGYWMPEDPLSDEVWVGIMLQFSPKSAARKEYASAFEKWSSRNADWETDSLTDDQEWGVICKGKGLSTFISYPDHVEAVRSYLLERLNEVSDFRTANPHLPWRGEQPMPESPIIEEADEQSP